MKIKLLAAAIGFTLIPFSVLAQTMPNGMQSGMSSSMSNGTPNTTPVSPTQTFAFDPSNMRGSNGQQCLVQVFNSSFTFPPEGGQITQIGNSMFFVFNFVPGCENAGSLGNVIVSSSPQAISQISQNVTPTNNQMSNQNQFQNMNNQQQQINQSHQNATARNNFSNMRNRFSNMRVRVSQFFGQFHKRQIHNNNR